jgi:hypothetical protein
MMGSSNLANDNLNAHFYQDGEDETKRIIFELEYGGVVSMYGTCTRRAHAWRLQELLHRTDPHYCYGLPVNAISGGQ